MGTTRSAEKVDRQRTRQPTRQKPVGLRREMRGPENVPESELPLQRYLGNSYVQATTFRDSSGFVAAPFVPHGFGPGSVKNSQTLRFAIGRRTGQPVTKESLLDWAFEQAGEGATVADLVASLTSSYDFAGGSSGERHRLAGILRDWEPELNAFRQERLRQQRAAQLKAIEEEIDRILFQQRMQRYPGRVEIRNYPVLTYHAAVGSIMAPLLPVVEILIGFIPIVGQAVAIIEAVSGRGLTGRELSASERGLSAMFAAIPAAGKLVRAGKSAASAIVHIAGKTRQLPRAVLQLIGGLHNAAPHARLVEEAMGIAARGGTLTAQHQQALQSTLKMLKETPITDSASVGRQVGKAGTAVRQSETVGSTGRQTREPTIGAASDVLGSARGVEKLYRSKRFLAARAQLQPIVNRINPCQGRKNCVPVTIATDMSLAQGKAFKAPVTLEHTGIEEVATRTGPLQVSRIKEVGFPRHVLEAYVGANMKSTGARALFRELLHAGHGSRAIIVKMGKEINHAYNVINWRGMLIAVDGQSRTVRPFAELLAKMVKEGDDWTMMWHRTN